MSRTTFYVGLGALAVAAAGFGAFISRPSAELGYRSLETVGSAPVERTRIASGAVKPAVTIDVRAEISGLVSRRKSTISRKVSRRAAFHSWPMGVSVRSKASCMSRGMRAGTSQDSA